MYKNDLEETLPQTKHDPMSTKDTVTNYSYDLTR